MEILEYQTHFDDLGISTKKSWKISAIYTGLSIKILGLSIEKLGISIENLGLSTKIWKSWNIGWKTLNIVEDRRFSTDIPSFSIKILEYHSGILEYRRYSWNLDLLYKMLVIVVFPLTWLTAHNWQKCKSPYLTCPCHKIYREEAVGLKRSNYTDYYYYDFC